MTSSAVREVVTVAELEGSTVRVLMGAVTSSDVRARLNGGVIVCELDSFFSSSSSIASSSTGSGTRIVDGFGTWLKYVRAVTVGWWAMYSSLTAANVFNAVLPGASIDFDTRKLMMYSMSCSCDASMPPYTAA